MQRIAAHYVWYRQVYRLHYIELNDDGTFAGIFPLQEEIAGTVFQDGILIPLLPEEDHHLPYLYESWPLLTEKVKEGSPVEIYKLRGLSAAAAKLGTDDSGGNGHIERL